MSAAAEIPDDKKISEGGLPDNLLDNKKTISGVLPVNLLDKQALYQSYMSYIIGGGLFIKTDKKYKYGEEVFLLIKLMDETKKYPVVGKVVWITPPCAQGGLATGIGVQFTNNDAMVVEVRAKIETYLAGALHSDRHTDTM